MPSRKTLSPRLVPIHSALSRLRAGDGFAAVEARLKSPRGVSIDPAGNVDVTDGANSRIRRMNVIAQLRIDPPRLNVHSEGRWLTAFIQLPAGRDARKVVLRSVRLQAIDPTNGSLRHSSGGAVLQVLVASASPSEQSDTDGDGVPDRLMVKFDRRLIASWVAGDLDLVLRVEGQFEPPAGFPVGRYFSGDVQVPVD